MYKQRDKKSACNKTLENGHELVSCRIRFQHLQGTVTERVLVPLTLFLVFAGARILQDSIRCLPEDSAAYAEEIGEHGQVLAHAIPKTDINSCSQSVLQKYNLSPMAKDFKQQEQTVLAEHVNALIKLVSSQASDSNRGISTLHAAARRSGSAAAEAQQWYIEQLAAWHPDQHSTVALSSTYKGLSQVQLHAFTSYGSSGNSSSNDGGSSNDHGSNGNGNGSRSSGGGSTSEGSSVALDRRPVSIFFVTGRQPQYASAQPNGFLNRRHVSVTGRPDNDMQYVVLTFSTATAWDDIQNLLTLLESCGTGMQLPPGVQLETRVNEGEWWRRVDVATGSTLLCMCLQACTATTTETVTTVLICRQ